MNLFASSDPTALPVALAGSTNSLALHSNLPDIGTSAIRAVAALAIVLAIFFAGVWLFRNGQRLSWRRNGSPKLAILESRALGNRYALYVVGYEQQRLLIGSSPAGLTLLSQLPPAALTGEATESPSGQVSFAQSLQQALSPK